MILVLPVSLSYLYWCIYQRNIVYLPSEHDFVAYTEYSAFCRYWDISVCMYDAPN